MSEFYLTVSVSGSCYCNVQTDCYSVMSNWDGAIVDVLSNTNTFPAITKSECLLWKKKCIHSAAPSLSSDLIFLTN